MLHSFHRRAFRAGPLFASSVVLTLSLPALADDLIINNTTVSLGGVHTYGTVSLTNNAKIVVTTFDGTNRDTTGNLVIRADSITIDATSSMVAKGAGYQAGLCRNGAGPAIFPLSGGRGGCSLRDSGGGGAHFGGGGRGTKDCPTSGCVFPQYYEESCSGGVVPANNACSDYTDCRNNDALPTVAGLPFFHSIYAVEFGAAGGDKGCRDGDGFALWPGTTQAVTGGAGGGRIVLFAANAQQTGALDIQGVINANGNRGCGAGNDSAGGGAGGTVLLIGDNVTIGQGASITAAGGLGGDTQPKADPECAGTQMNGTCDDCGGGGGGGIINVLSRVASIHPQAAFNVRGALGGVCPICQGEAGGSAGELQIDGAYVGEVCDGWDNDFNGLVDDNLPELNCGGVSMPSCVNGVPQQCPADTPACIGPVDDTRPRFVVIVDSSGSMLDDVSGKPTFGDGSSDHPGVDTSSDPDTIDGNNSRLYIAKRALNNVLAAFPHADYALARYHQDVSTRRSCQTASWFECQNLCCSYDDPRDNVAPAHPNPPGCNMQSLYSAGYPAALNTNINIGWPNQDDCINYAGSCGAPRRGADILVGFQHPLEQELMWLDGHETSFNSSTLPGDHCSFATGGDCELRATGPTPLAGALDAAADYLKPIIQCDRASACRKYAVILLTDGVESCQGDPIATATALRNTVPSVPIQTYVVGFSVLASEQAQLNAIAAAGGTGNAFFASDENGLSNALASIIAASTNFEKCNNLDDDCDGLIDEDFPDKGAACDDGGKGICKGTGARVCNAAGDGTECQITSPGQSPQTEVCNGLDDNCNGLIDEGGVCQQCVPTVEVCNGLDDNCDGVIDDNPVDVGKPCGLSVGECSAGTTVCNSGKLECQNAVGPQAEVCDGLDNDCNGIVDGMTRPCYSGASGTEGIGVCRAGSEPCAAAAGSGTESWGACVGEVIPSPEICDGLDNDCNGLVDDHVSDGLGHQTGDSCCQSGTKCGTGVCTYGVYACAGSQIVCDGGELPSAEQCDGLDNDCNGEIDDVPGRGASCAMPGGCAGVLDCVTGTGLVCVAAASGLEVCNGIDDDCDGSIDEEPDVSVNDDTIGVECNVPQPPNDFPPCKAGTTICKAGVVTCDGAVEPTAEICDGIDNDCDGTIDQPNPCPGTQLCTDGVCRNPCGGGEFACPGGEKCVNNVCIPIGEDAGTDSGEPDGSAGAGGTAGTGGAGGASPDGGGGSSGTGGSAAAGGTGGTGAGGSLTGGTGGSSQPETPAAQDNYGLSTGGGGIACSVGATGARATGGLSLALLALGIAGARRKARRDAAKGGAK